MPLSHLALRGVVCGAYISFYGASKPWDKASLSTLTPISNLIIDTDDSDLASSIQPHSSSTPISISNSKFRQLRHLQILGTTAPIHCILDELKGLANLISLKIDRESDTVTPWGFQVQVQDISEIWKSFSKLFPHFLRLKTSKYSIDLKSPFRLLLWLLFSYWTIWRASSSKIALYFQDPMMISVC